MVSRKPQTVFDALASPIRREILWLTRTEELSAGEIGRHFDKSAATISSHLAVLRDVGLLTMRVDGNFRRFLCNLDAVTAVIPLLASDDLRWVTNRDAPEARRARVASSSVVVVEVEVPIGQESSFAAFVDEDRYQRWLGVPVTIRDRHFSATMEWGTEIRGIYEVVSPPSLIAMRWDFDDAAIPIPGRELIAYLRIEPTEAGSRVTVQQLATDAQQASFLATAWSLVLGRFADAHQGIQTPAPRVTRRRSAPG